jgi:hypothetical protein
MGKSSLLPPPKSLDLRLWLGCPSCLPIKPLRASINVLSLVLEDRQKFFHHEVIIGNMLALR